MGKAARLARDILGDQFDRLHIQAHGTGTPQNRTTESQVLNSIAKAFAVTWPVCASKCFVGHSLGSAAGDQLGSALGVLTHQILPGIVTVDQCADDVERSHLSFSQAHRQFPDNHFQAAIINAKGFGGNNASAVVLSAQRTQSLLQRRYPNWRDYQRRLQDTLANQDSFVDRLRNEPLQPIYRYGDHVIEGHQLDITDRQIRLPGHRQAVNLDSGWTAW
jgi:acetoacetyl-[acyl-carrier protein] synthase